MCRQSSGESCVERDAVEDAGIADDGVQSSEGVDRGVDDGLAALGTVHRIMRSDRPSARFLDLVDHLIGNARIRAVATHGAPEVVNHHRRAPPRQVEGIQPAQPTAGPSHDRDLALEVDHGALLADSAPSVGSSRMRAASSRSQEDLI